MFPKNTMTTTVAMPPEKPPVPGQKDSAVMYVGTGEDGDQQVYVDQGRHGQTKRAIICACAVVLVTLILVAGTLGTITIVLTHVNRMTFDRGPITDREPLFDNQPKLPDPSPRIKIDDGGLWLPDPVTPDLVTPDLVAVDAGVDDDIKFDDNDANDSIQGPNGNDVLVDESGLITAPNSERPFDLEFSISSSDWASEESSDDYENGRTYISSSFPYDGYYMRGEVGNPPWEESQYSETVADGSGSSSGDGELGQDSEDDDEDDSGSGGRASSDASVSEVSSSPNISSSSNPSSSESYPNTFSDMYYDS